MSVKIFNIPFAESGEKEAIPDKDSSGYVSYSSGYTEDYEKDPINDNGKPIERKKVNQIFFDITSNLKAYQTQTFANWGAKDSLGANEKYPKDAIVRYNNLVYRSLENDNTSTPSDVTKWVEFTSVSTDAPVGAIIEYPSNTPPKGWAICDGSSFDKNVYKELYTLLGSDSLPSLKGMVLKGIKTGQTLLSFEPQSVAKHTHTGNVKDNGAHTHKIGTIRIQGKCNAIGTSAGAKSSGCFRYDVLTTDTYIQVDGSLTVANNDLIYDASKGWSGEMATDGIHGHLVNTDDMPSKDNIVDNIGVNFIIKLG